MYGLYKLVNKKYIMGCPQESTVPPKTQTMIFKTYLELNTALQKWTEIVVLWSLTKSHVSLKMDFFVLQIEGGGGGG